MLRNSFGSLTGLESVIVIAELFTFGFIALRPAVYLSATDPSSTPRSSLLERPSDAATTPESPRAPIGGASYRNRHDAAGATAHASLTLSAITRGGSGNDPSVYRLGRLCELLCAYHDWRG